MAFSNSSVALVHGMSRPIGAFYHVPHGLSNAMLLPTVTEFSIPGAPEKYSKCAKAIQVADVNDSIDTSNKKLLNELKQINIDLQVPTLADFGVKKETFFENIDTMAIQAIASGSPSNNPIVPSHDQVVSLYKKLWN